MASPVAWFEPRRKETTVGPAGKGGGRLAGRNGPKRLPRSHREGGFLFVAEEVVVAFLAAFSQGAWSGIFFLL